MRGREAQPAHGESPAARAAAPAVRSPATEDLRRLPVWASRAQPRHGRAPAQLQSAEGTESVDRASPAPSFLPETLRAAVERALGADFSGVRIHQDATPATLGARAYAQGSDLYFAPGEFDPDSARGQVLIAHELVHVVQQAQGRVQATSVVNGAAVNDDPALEREAAEQGAQAVGQPAEVAETKSPEAVADPAGEVLATDPVAAAAGGLNGSDPPIQLQPGEATYVAHQIVITQPLTGEEFKALAMRQVFGVEVSGVTWRGIKDAYAPESSPVQLKVELGLLLRNRAEANQQRGIELDPSAGVAGAGDRVREFRDLPASDRKAALLAEIDRRYYQAIGSAEHKKITKGQAGEAELWKTIRDEVLFQREYLGNLPPKVQQLVKVSIKGRVLTPADYDQMFRIAKKIEAMPLGEVADYAAKVAGTTTDLTTFEQAVDRYVAEAAERTAQTEDREAVQHRLLGLDQVYAKYRLYVSVLVTEAMSAGAALSGAGAGPSASLPIGPTASSMLRDELTAQLKLHNFSSITEFETFIKKFEVAFEHESADIAKDVLAQYAGRLYQESVRYQNADEVATLHGRLGGLRARYQEVEVNAKISNEYKENSELARLPGNAHLQPTIGPDEARAAYDRAAAAKAAAQAEFVALAGEYPVFAEETLPDDRKIDKVALAKAGQSQLGDLLRAQVARRRQDVGEAEAQLDVEPELIYKLTGLMPRFYAEQHIAAGSIYDMIIQDKLKSDLILKIGASIALAIIAVALAVISFGTATPAIIAAGASLAGFGLSAYMAYDEYREYVQQKDLADVGFQDDPSVIWLVIAVVAAAVDMGAAVKAISKLGPAAKTLNVAGDFGDFARVVAELKRSGLIDAKIAAAAEKAAAARTAAAGATRELGRMLAGHAHTLTNPFTDPDVYRTLVKIAAARFKEGMHSSVVFVEELKKARALAKLGDLTPEEMIKAKEAWEQAVKLAKSAETPIEITSESGRVIGRFSNGSHLEILSRSGDELHGGQLIRLDPDATTTVTGVLSDVDVVATRGARLPGATVMGENVGGINILRSPRWAEIQAKHLALKSTDPAAYWRQVTDEFWEVANKPWLDEAIARGDKFRFVSNPLDEAMIHVTDKAGSLILENGQKIKSIFGREVDYLTSKGYQFLSDGTATRAR